MARIKWTVLRDIDRIHIDRQQREGGYVMPAHHYHPYYAVSYTHLTLPTNREV